MPANYAKIPPEWGIVKQGETIKFKDRNEMRSYLFDWWSNSSGAEKDRVYHVLTYFGSGVPFINTDKENWK